MKLKFDLGNSPSRFDPDIYNFLDNISGPRYPMGSKACFSNQKAICDDRDSHQ